MLNAQPPAQVIPSFSSSMEMTVQLALQGSLPIVDLFNVAESLSADGLVPEMIALYRLWLEGTDSPLAYAVRFNLAVALSNIGDTAAAEQLYREAMTQNPNFVEARLNLGMLLERLGRQEEALFVWNNILIEVQPPVSSNKTLYVQTLNNLGRLLEIRKQNAAAENMLMHSLQANAEQPGVLTHWVHLRQKQCKWPIYSGLWHIPREVMLRDTSALAMLSASADPAQQLAAAKRFVDTKVISDVKPLTGDAGYAHERLRIGYLSSDLCLHAVSILTAELYELHDRSKVEVYAFCWSKDDGTPMQERVRRAMDHHIRIADMSDEEAAHCIFSHEIDILIDLHGLTQGARPNILSYRPAPVQITYLGFPGTTALPGIDYVIADEFVLPPDTAAFFTEKPLYLPDTFQINDRQRLIGPRPSKEVCGLPETGFIFCSFNNNFKFTEEVFATWMRILLHVPESVLWLVADDDQVKDNLRASARQAGVASERLIFAGRATPSEYLARYQLADLFLDTSPFGAGTTASDALWAGLPLLTYAGDTFASRMAGSLLRAVELPELITYSLHDYEELAIALAAAPERIEAMKQKLQENRSDCALFDSPRFVRNFETALFKVVKPPKLVLDYSSAMPVVDIQSIPVVTVSYNSPELIDALLTTLRKFYRNPVYVIDGSREDIAPQIHDVINKFESVDFIPFGYNIHHGPGMAWAIENLELTGAVLFLDSDVEILRSGFLESLYSHLSPELYGVGSVLQVNEQGIPLEEGGMAYLHPACMLCNIDIVRQWPLPIKHGAPMMPPMLALMTKNLSMLVKNVDWVTSDFGKNTQRNFIKHDWQGTVIRTGGYHYDSPAASEHVNMSLLAFVPKSAIKVVDIGCGNGAFAKAYKKRNPLCNYIGIERNKELADSARSHCDFVFNADVEEENVSWVKHCANADCWILGEVLERMLDPWALFDKIRKAISPNGLVVVSISNAQHWSRQVKLNLGDWGYGDTEVFCKDELRQFTRASILDFFEKVGFRVTGGAPVILDEPHRDVFLPLLKLMAQASKNDPDVAIQDALPSQFIITAIPV